MASNRTPKEAKEYNLHQNQVLPFSRSEPSRKKRHPDRRGAHSNLELNERFKSLPLSPEGKAEVSCE